MLVNQLEWANVLLLNKCDLVSPSQRDRAISLLRTLNPTATIIPTVRSRVDLKELLDTRRFAFETAALSAGWLRSLREEVKPETEEYGIGSVVDRASGGPVGADVARVAGASFTARAGRSARSGCGR